MSLHRRALLGLFSAGAAGAAAPVAARSISPVAFLHGVASGDPGPDGVVIWTRVTPTDPTARAVRVDWSVWREGDAAASVTAGTVETGPERDFTVKIPVTGLQPGVDYRYAFTAGEAVSPHGRTRTLPAGPTPEVVLAVASCQLFPGGLFNAWDAVSKLERLDAVVHLGDYIYEYGAEPDAYGMASGAPLGRIPEPAHEIVSLADYRTRHAQYKSDPDLQAAHARAPFICVWDDHELANDAWTEGAENHTSATEGEYATRKAAALKAYFEWMPIREPAAGLTPEAIQRSFDFGDLASLLMVETRLLARGQQLTYGSDMPVADGRPDVAAFEAKRNDPARDLLGDSQRDWIRSTLQASRASGKPWQVIGNQVVMARVQGPDITTMANPLQIAGLLATLPAAVRAQVRQSIDLFKLGVPFNLDSWDGYPAGRERLYAAFAEAGVQPIVLAGDSHAFWIDDLKDAAGARRGVEFGTSAISSPSPGDAVPRLPLGAALMQANDEVVFCDQSAKGYVLLTLTPDQARAELRTVSTLFAKPYQAGVLKTFTVARTAEGLGELVEV
ncbi:MAG: alkaline phosphatase D family protein [Alphaproteobacteria bacterium]|jgi:alkaline phosphatase D|nr:alkaline phosphatase D family protein [Alphaproteobacteria bacterium]MBU2040923.1 alkaline phosphatase D family protein [Alphaproteobacteria bacterium]MBU2126234.1 alkaline phosphatase D family protein [Alphaproteobacteria bacterium]MBU2207414.1 alkaline phosphatase D family protein [Alphaproteobacteria bacterium]